MPIYEYQCKTCNHRLEAMQKFSDPLLKDCPKCHQPELKKLVSVAAFHLKGTGWYQTDFKDKPKTNNATGGAEECPKAPSCSANNCSMSESKI